MRKFGLVSTLVLILLLAGRHSSAQDFSNKGKEFWLSYSYHVGMLGGGPPVMTLYITSDVATTYTVEIYNGPIIATGNLTAGQVIPVIIPNAYFINDEGRFSNRTIRVTAPKPVVVYSYITRSAASGATLCLPTNVLGKEYYSMNFTQFSNENNSNSYFTIIAVEDNTTVDITPSADTKNGWLANTTYTITLNKGDIYQVLGTTTGFNGVDLTGSIIRSVSSAGGGCKKIAVFSGSGKIRIPTSGCGQNASDNLYQQLYPTGSWGKKYLTAPSANNPFNYYRIAKSNPAANVYVNGVLIPAASFTNNFYQFFNNTPNLIESDLPISVAQYFTTQGCDGNPASVPYDPDMIMLNPVEQNIDQVTLVSSNLAAASTPAYPHQHHIHAIMRNGGSGISSFRLDGNPVPVGNWTVHPANPAYSYLYMNNVSQGYHTLSSDSGFNATAYGYANFESYGYSAGANVKDLYQFVSISNQYASVDFPAACKGAPSSLSMTFPYQPTQIVWEFNGLFPDVTLNSPVFSSSSVVNGRTLYKYDLAGTYTMPSTGTYPIRIVALNPTADGCSGVQEIDIELQVFDPPTAAFNFATNGCVSSPVNFTDNTTNTGGRTITHWHWNFGDGNTANDVANTSHTYAAPGSYTVKYTVITDIGCIADTTPATVVLNNPPIAQFSPVTPYCAGKTITFNDNSTSGSGSISKWIWNFGDGSPIITAATNASQAHTYANPGPYTVTLQVETASGCLSTVTSNTITVRPNPVPVFNLPNVCLPTGAAQFNSTSTISDGTESQFTYLWDFGDATPTAAVQNPLHNYAAAGPYNVSLTVTSNNGCATTLTQNLTTIYAEPQAQFNAPAEVCLGASASFTDNSTAPGSTVTQWLWNFGDATTSTSQNPTKTYTAPGTYTVTLSVTSAIGCQTITPSHIATRTIIVNALPTAGFNVSLPGCIGQGVTFTSTSVPNSGNIVKWTWDYGDATNAVLTTGAPLVHTYAAINTYNATLTVETDKGCISTVFPRSVVINSVPVAGFAFPEICVGDNLAPFTDNSTGNVTGWEWNFGDANATPPGNPNISTLQNPTHHFTAPGSYNVQLIATNSAGCKDTTSNPVPVNGGVLVPQFSIENTGPLCSNKSITIKDASTIDAGNILRVEIYWDATDLTNVIIDDAPAFGKTYTHTYPEFSTPATRTFTVRYLVYSGITCVEEITQPVTLLATPQLAFGSVLPVCSNVDPFQLSPQLVNNLPGSGAFTGPGVSATGLFDPEVAGNGQHAIIYTYTGTNGCVNTITQELIVNPTPVADAGPDRFVLEGGFITLNPTLITNIPVSYSWSPGTYLNNPSIANAQASPPADFMYTLTVTSDKGCTDDDEVLVKLLKSLVIPNIFSPNGDGINDRWVIEHLDSYPGCVVQIYNRYGQMVQRFANYTTAWDGKINGQDAPLGTYYYIIDPKNGRKPITGYVDIIR